MLKLRQLCFQKDGVNLEGIRPIIWRILLNAWSMDPNKWDDQMETNYKEYTMWRGELVTTLDKVKEQYAEDGLTGTQF